jgi:hypothetical protein
MIYDYHAGFHKEPTDSVSMAMEIIKAMGAVEYLQKVTLTVDGIKSVAPVLLEMAGNDKLIQKLRDHDSYMRDSKKERPRTHSSVYFGYHQAKGPRRGVGSHFQWQSLRAL